MANQEWENDQWLNERLAALEPNGAWTPDAAHAYARFRGRTFASTAMRTTALRRWVWTTVVAAIAVGVLWLVPASRSCARQPGACVLQILGGVSSPSAHP
jgi:hypothetical protein